MLVKYIGSDPADSDMYLVANSELQHNLREKAEETKERGSMP